MAYIIVVNPNTLSGRAGGLEEELMALGRRVLATIIASIIGTLVMGLVANVPYAQARHGPERVLRVHRLPGPGLHLAADPVHGVHLRFN